MKKIMWGIILVVIGLLLGLKSLGVINFNIFFDGWWTLFIIVPCAIDLFTDDDKTGDLIGIAVGVVLLLACQDMVDFATVWKLIFPAILVIIGLSLIFKDALNSKIKKKIKDLNKNNTDDEKFATFSTSKLDYANEEFKGCKVSAVFGGMDINLVDAKISSDAVIDVSSIFGGVNILLPNNVNVKINSTSIFGGVDNKIKNHNNGEITIYINATCIFGGVEIK